MHPNAEGGTTQQDEKTQASPSPPPLHLPPLSLLLTPVMSTHPHVFVYPTAFERLPLHFCSHMKWEVLFLTAGQGSSVASPPSVVSLCHLLFFIFFTKPFIVPLLIYECPSSLDPDLLSNPDCSIIFLLRLDVCPFINKSFKMLSTCGGGIRL